MIDEVITADNTSASTNPTSNVSDIIVSIDGAGTVLLECRKPSGKWEQVSNRSGAYSIYTPDINLEYRFRGLGLKGSAAVYMAP